MSMANSSVRRLDAAVFCLKPHQQTQTKDRGRLASRQKHISLTAISRDCSCLWWCCTLSRHQTRRISRTALPTPIGDPTRNSRPILPIFDGNHHRHLLQLEVHQNRQKRSGFSVQRSANGSAMRSNCQIVDEQPRENGYVRFPVDFARRGHGGRFLRTAQGDFAFSDFGRAKCSSTSRVVV